MLLKGGIIVNSDRKYAADILIENNTIKHIGVDLVVSSDITVINVANKLILPGGIDSSTNFCFSSEKKDKLKSDSRLAIEGGSTTIINRVSSAKGSSLINTLQTQCPQLKNQLFCNFGFYALLDIEDENCSKEMKELVQTFGINCFEINIGLKVNKNIVSVMKECADLGCLLRIRTKDSAFEEILAQGLVSEGITGPEGFIQSRVIEDEIESIYHIGKLLRLCDCAVFVPQVMNKEVAGIISSMKKNGKSVFCETITAALCLDSGRYYLSNWDGAAAAVTEPPLRELQAADLIRSLQNGDVDMLASQHTTITAEERAEGQQDFRKIPHGISGVKERMSILWETGVKTGMIDECEFVAITSANAAKLFNLYPKRGYIGIGSIADIVVWDPEKKFTTSSDEVNIFDGISGKGAPDLVVVNGVIKFQNNAIVQNPSGEKVDLKNNCKMIVDKIKQHQQRENLGKVVVNHDYNNTVKSSDKDKGQANNKESGDDNNGQKGDLLAKTQRPPTSSGSRNMQDSSFAFSGAQIDDDRPNRSSIRTNQPPGGKSSQIW